MTAWNDLLRQARERRPRFSQVRLAGEAGVSVGTVSNYERGVAPPQRETLVRLTRALELGQEEINLILSGAGLDPEPAGRLAVIADLRMPPAAVQQELARYRWPCLAMNERYEVVGWNDAANRTAELDFGVDLPLPYQRNVLRVLAMPHIRRRAQNWKTIAAMAIAQYKLNQQEVTGESDDGYFARLVDDLHRVPGNTFSQLMDLWRTVPVWPEGKRITYRALWGLDDGARLAFDCVLSSWSDFDGLAALDWYPADAETLTWLADAAAEQVAGVDGGASPMGERERRRSRRRCRRGTSYFGGRATGPGCPSSNWRSRVGRRWTS